MKRTIVVILLCGIMLMELSGCEIKRDVSINEINGKIINYFQENGVEV